MEELKLDDFLKYRFISKLNTNKKDEVFMCVQKASEDLLGYDKDLYFYKNGLRQLTHDGKLLDYFLLNDDTCLLIENKKDEYLHFAYLNYYSGIYKEAFKLPLFNAEIKMINKDTLAILSSIDKNNPDLYLDKDYQEKVKGIKDQTYEILDEDPYWFNGAGFVSGKRTALFTLNINDPSSLKRISDANMDFSKMEVKDGVVYLLGEAYTHKPSRYPSLYKYDGNLSCIYENKDVHIYDFYFKDKGFIIVGSDEKTWGINQNPTIYYLDTKLKVFYDNKESFSSSVGSDCRLGPSRSMMIANNELYYVSTRYNGSYLYVNDGEEKKVSLNTDGSIDDFVVKDNGVYYVAMLNNKLQELYYLDLDSNKEVQLTHFNDDVLKDKYVADYEELKFTCHDEEIYGFVLKPKDYDPNKKYPAILDIHGGPKTVYGKVFYHEMQYWANNGYFVLFSNPIGSDGRGNSFMYMSGRYGSDDYDCLMGFVDEVLKKYPSIDVNKVFETGGSYGGFMTNWIIGHTNRFKACASQRSISNWISFAGTSDIGYEFVNDQILALDLDKDINKLWEKSPLRYASNVKTPTLFIHSDEDYRCPIEQGLQMMNALIQRSVDTRMCYFHHENHELSRGGKPINRIKRLKEITNWFELYKEDKNV